MRDLAPDTETEIEFGDLTLHLCWELEIETLLGDRLDAEARAVEEQALEDGR